MNKRFFAEFLALLSLKVNPDPDANDDAEIDIVKQIFAHNRDSPSAPEIPTKFPDDTSIDFYDEEESTGGSCTSSCKDNNPQHHETRNRWDWMLLYNATFINTILFSPLSQYCYIIKTSPHIFCSVHYKSKSMYVSNIFSFVSILLHLKRQFFSRKSNSTFTNVRLSVC